MAANPWTPDVELSQEGARALLERCFPALAPAALVHLGQGWDNDAYVVNDAYVFRFPRRAIAAELIRSEARVLPRIRGRVPVPVPDPRFVVEPPGIAEPHAGYPYPFVGYPLLPGTSADAVPLDDEERKALAAPLGAFLRALHDVPPADAPADLIARADMRSRLPLLEEKLARARPFLPAGVTAEAVLGRARAHAQARPHAGALRLVHGDLYARHLLLDDDKRLAGVIDWGDVHQGDPALDVSIAFAFLPPRARAGFFAHYGEVDVHLERRARFRALFSGAALIDYGRSAGDDVIAAAGEVALRFALT